MAPAPRRRGAGVVRDHRRRSVTAMSQNDVRRRPVGGCRTIRLVNEPLAVAADSWMLAIAQDATTVSRRAFERDLAGRPIEDVDVTLPIRVRRHERRVRRERDIPAVRAHGYRWGIVRRAPFVMLRD